MCRVSAEEGAGDEGPSAFGEDPQQENPYDQATTAIPDVFRDGSGTAGQEEVYARVMGETSVYPRELQEYKSMSHVPLRLSKLQRMYEADQATPAMQLLLKKQRLIFEADYIVDPWSSKVELGIREVCCDDVYDDCGVLTCTTGSTGQGHRSAEGIWAGCGVAQPARCRGTTRGDLRFTGEYVLHNFTFTLACRLAENSRNRRQNKP